MLREYYTEEMRRKAEQEEWEDSIRKETAEQVRKETEEKVRKETEEKIYKKTIQTLYKNGLSIDKIAECFNQDLDEIKDILKIQL